MMKKSLPASRLRNSFKSSELDIDSARKSPMPQEIIGQERAVKALEFGLGFKAPGFNIYIAGPPGSGKVTAIKGFLEKIAKSEPTPDDWCYVNNFDSPYHPHKLALPPGMGKQFKKDMANFVMEGKRILNTSFESEEYGRRKEEILSKYKTIKNDLFKILEKQADNQGFLIKQTQLGIYAVPVKEGKLLSEKQFEKLSDTEQNILMDRQSGLEERLQKFVKESRKIEKKANDDLSQLDTKIALYALLPLVDELKDSYIDQPEIIKFLDKVKDDILDNLEAFMDGKSRNKLPFPIPAAFDQAAEKKYDVNVLVDHSGNNGAPVVIERNPILNDLFGRIDKESTLGTLVTDFTLIRSGSFHQANGGYLVIPVKELLTNPFAWESLKMTLRNQEIRIEDIGDKYGFMSSKGLKPEPIPLNLQVVLFGDPMLYYLLYRYDQDFRELFKVKADFDTTMERNSRNLRAFVSFLSKIQKEEDLLPLAKSGYAKIIELSSRLAEDQKKLSTRFGDILDYVREAGHYAFQDKASRISSGHVTRAVDQKLYRSGLIRDKINEMISGGQILIDLEGQRVGQVNGLAVLDLGDICFGRPNRITASVGVGNKGIIDIERESKLGGPIHTKGIMILTGFLYHRFGQDKPLALSASLVFEQSYSGVEGDSASCAELYSIMSALSGLRINQGIAVTGSVNQMGEVQAIGGINEKIEGYFDVCQLLGPRPNQGVIIPASNVKNLMLSDRTLEEVKKGNFQIWAVKYVDEGIEILTGVKAGKLGKSGLFPSGSINNLVDQRLRRMYEQLRKGKKDRKKA